MAAELVGGAALGVLAQKIVEGILLVHSCKDECEKLETRLKRLISLLEKIQHTGNAVVYDWAKDFESLLNRVDPIVMKCQKRRGRVFRIYAGMKYGPKILKFIQEIDDEMKIAPMVNLVLAVTREEAANSTFLLQVVPGKILGMENSFHKLKKSIRQGFSKEGPSYIGILGQGGSGKTLLAQGVNNDNDIRGAFGEDSILWITIGRDALIPEKYITMRKFLRIREADAAGRGLKDQRTQLVNGFSKKRVLLILDDVWDGPCENEQMIEWLDVAKGAGSVTLVTTRLLEVLTLVRAEVEEMPLLSAENSWKLFCIHAFPKDTPRLESGIQAIAKEVCKKCKCLPLALKVIGSAMRGKTDIGDWNFALHRLKDSRPFDGSMKTNLYNRLRLSYDGLDEVLKKCFLYLGAFPEDFALKAEDLYKVWISEEVFGKGIDEKDAREEARYALKILSMRSLIQVSLNIDVTIHDILRDLAIHIFREAAQERLLKPLMDLKEYRGAQCKIDLRVKKMSLVFNYKREYLTDGNAPDYMRNCMLESLILWKCTMQVDFFSTMENLRYLEMTYMSGLEELPESIAGLKFLRYLNLGSCKALKKLPEAIGGLQALEHLNLCECEALVELPQTIGDLRSLRYLNLDSCKALRKLPEAIGGLRALEHLHLRGCKALVEIPNTIGDLRSLICLGLTYCKALKELPEILRCLVALEHLHISR